MSDASRQHAIEIRRLYSPELILPFNGTLMDLSGNGNDATAVGTSAYESGVIQSAVATDNTNYVSVPDDATIDIGLAEDFFVSFWIRTTTTPALGTVEFFRKKDSINNDSAGYTCYGISGVLVFQVGSDGERTFSTSSRSLIEDNQWHHVLFGINRSLDLIYAYVDRELDEASGGAEDGMAVLESLENNNPLLIYTSKAADVRFEQFVLAKTAPTQEIANYFYLTGKNGLL